MQLTRNQEGRMPRRRHERIKEGADPGVAIQEPSIETDGYEASFPGHVPGFKSPFVLLGPHGDSRYGPLRELFVRQVLPPPGLGLLQVSWARSACRGPRAVPVASLAIYD